MSTSSQASAPFSVAKRESLQQLLKKICTSLQNEKNILVAFSGGIDSTLVAKISQMAVGEQNVVAVTAVSPSLAQRDRQNAQQIAKVLHLRHVTLASHETKKPAYQKNQKDRCFHCKSHLYALLQKFAKEKNYQTIANGTNADDVQDYRPGLIAASNFHVVSPLLDFGVSKQTVRDLARLLHIPNWDRPASPCLASRVPYGMPIDVRKLSQIEKAEQILHQLGFTNFRVRHHDDIARIEIHAGDFSKIVNPEIRTRIRKEIAQLNFSYVCIDLSEFRSGRLNDPQPKKDVNYTSTEAPVPQEAGTAANSHS